jgi:hypothetical protein
MNLPTDQIEAIIDRRDIGKTREHEELEFDNMVVQFTLQTCIEYFVDRNATHLEPEEGHTEVSVNISDVEAYDLEGGYPVEFNVADFIWEFYEVIEQRYA